MLCGGDDALGGFPMIGIESGVPAVDSWYLSPELARAFAAAIPNVKSNDLLGLAINGDPDPLLVRLTSDKTPHFIGLRCKSQEFDPTSESFGRLDIEIIRQRFINFGDEGQQPPRGFHPGRGRCRTTRGVQAVTS